MSDEGPTLLSGERLRPRNSVFLAFAVIAAFLVMVAVIVAMVRVQEDRVKDYTTPQKVVMEERVGRYTVWSMEVSGGRVYIFQNEKTGWCHVVLQTQTSALEVEQGPCKDTE